MFVVLLRAFCASVANDQTGISLVTFLFFSRKGDFEIAPAVGKPPFLVTNL